MKRKTSQPAIRAILILAIFLAFILAAYAAVDALLSRSWSSNLEKGDLFDMALNQGSLTGEVLPGSSLSVYPTIENKGTKNALAYIKVTVPTYGESNHPAYKYETSSGWTLVEDNGNERVYGFTEVLGSTDVTDPLTNVISMVDMNSAEFLSMGDVNFSFTGYLADCDTYSQNLAEGWTIISSQY